MSFTAQSGRPGEGAEARGHVPLLTRLVATGLFTGYIPWASGTFGSLLGVLLFVLAGAWQPLICLAMIAGGFAAGVVTARRVAAVEGDRLTSSAAAAKALFQPGRSGEPDPSIVVIDEIVGMWIALCFFSPTPAALCLTFVLFRLFDVVKPPPARQVEKLSGGWGIMLDDVVAGVYANITARVLLAAGTLVIPGLR